MEVQLQEIIDKIKRDGLDSARQDADRLVAEAERKAGEIVAKAQSEAESIKAKAQTEAQRFEASAKASVAQAARDLNLTLKKNIEQLFSSLVTEAVKAEYQGKVLEEAILSAVKAFSTQSDKATVVVSPELAASLASSLKGKLKDKAQKELSIEASPSVRFGFRIQDGGAYYDFTVEAISQALASYVNPAVASIIKQA